MLENEEMRRCCNSKLVLKILKAQELRNSENGCLHGWVISKFLSIANMKGVRFWSKF